MQISKRYKYQVFLKEKKKLHSFENAVIALYPFSQVRSILPIDWNQSKKKKKKPFSLWNTRVGINQREGSLLFR